MTGLTEFLLTNDYSIVDSNFVGHGADASLQLFDKGIEPTTFFVRNDIVDRLDLPIQPSTS
jgi:hypothetical protein